jgi:cytochrome P450
VRIEHGYMAPPVRVRAAAAKARAWLDQIIAKRKRQDLQPDDVVGRCLALQKASVPGIDDLGIRNSLLGLVIGAIPTTSKCCASGDRDCRICKTSYLRVIL